MPRNPNLVTNTEIFGDFYFLPSSPFTHSLPYESYFTLTNSHLKNTQTAAISCFLRFLSFIQGQEDELRGAAVLIPFSYSRSSKCT
ncbi:hypothetical protein ES332_D12G124200v1 [Gossypium tomentosum]|uniref:Uncharacterized protein n=1 Tax=Gossypium tomentosum TaxID=34277 RepID=A0A5D2I7S6_GOSTO|nr:hypothetical protein ES332_D12G124200v1 [Gossypium tomentosum]